MKKIFMLFSLLLSILYCNAQCNSDGSYILEKDSIECPEAYEKYLICKQIFQDIISVVGEMHKPPPNFRIKKTGHTNRKKPSVAEYDGIDTITIQEELIDHLLKGQNRIVASSILLSNKNISKTILSKIKSKANEQGEILVNYTSLRLLGYVIAHELGHHYLNHTGACNFALPDSSKTKISMNAIQYETLTDISINIWLKDLILMSNGAYYEYNIISFLDLAYLDKLKIISSLQYCPKNENVLIENNKLKESSHFISIFLQNFYAEFKIDSLKMQTHLSLNQRKKLSTSLNSPKVQEFFKYYRDYESRYVVKGHFPTPFGDSVSSLLNDIAIRLYWAKNLFARKDSIKNIGLSLIINKKDSSVFYPHLDYGTPLYSVNSNMYSMRKHILQEISAKLKGYSYIYRSNNPPKICDMYGIPHNFYKSVDSNNISLNNVSLTYNIPIWQIFYFKKIEIIYLYLLYENEQNINPDISDSAFTMLKDKYNSLYGNKLTNINQLERLGNLYLPNDTNVELSQLKDTVFNASKNVFLWISFNKNNLQTNIMEKGAKYDKHSYSLKIIHSSICMDCDLYLTKEATLKRYKVPRVSSERVNTDEYEVHIHLNPNVIFIFGENDNVILWLPYYFPF